MLRPALALCSLLLVTAEPTRAEDVPEGLLAQFGDDFIEPICFEDRRRFRKRSQRGSGTTQLFLNLLQFARLLHAPQRSHNRIEEEQKQEHAILVVVQITVPGAISLATVIVQSPQQRRELIEVLEPRDIWLLDLLL